MVEYADSARPKEQLEDYIKYYADNLSNITKSSEDIVNKIRAELLVLKNELNRMN